MKQFAIAVLGAALLLSACTGQSPVTTGSAETYKPPWSSTTVVGLLGDREAISCGPQREMTGDLQMDLPGIWRLAWSGDADGGPSQMLMVFVPGGVAESYSERFGVTRWSWSIYGTAEVRMWNHHVEGDSSVLSATWTFRGDEWEWAAIGYGETELRRCVSTEN